VPLVIGDKLADNLSLRVGDPVDLDHVVTALSALDKPDGAPRKGRVTGILHTGDDATDAELALTPLAAAQRLIGRGDEVLWTGTGAC
jgi:ABC-type lipoprotein release transport system permease subunit